MTIVGKALKAIANIFSSIRPDIKKAAGIAVAAVDMIYNLVNSPIASLAVSITKSTMDDRMRNSLVVALPKVIARLNIFQVYSDMPFDQMALKVAQTVHSLQIEDKNGERLKLATALALELSEDGDLSWSDAIKVVQYIKDGAPVQ